MYCEASWSCPKAYYIGIGVTKLYNLATIAQQQTWSQHMSMAKRAVNKHAAAAAVAEVSMTFKMQHGSWKCSRPKHLLASTFSSDQASSWTTHTNT